MESLPSGGLSSLFQGSRRIPAASSILFVPLNLPQVAGSAPLIGLLQRGRFFVANIVLIRKNVPGGAPRPPGPGSERRLPPLAAMALGFG